MSHAVTIPAPAPKPVPPPSAAVRTHLVDTLRRDLIGPAAGQDDDLAHEILPARPSRWYLTGYLKPQRQPDEVEASPAVTEGELGAIQGGADANDDGADDLAGTRRTFLPSSIGISALLPAGTASIEVCATWGDYSAQDMPTADAEGVAATVDDPASQNEPVTAGDSPASALSSVGTLSARAIAYGTPAEGSG